MSPITLQDYEYQIVADLIATYELNNTGKGMAHNKHGAFRRHPAPAIMEDEAHDCRHLVSDVEKKRRLAWEWESTIFQLGSARSTGLTPQRFAQAFIEVEGGLWRFYHPSRSGEQVAEAMCAFWAVKTKHWRTTSAAEARANIISKTGEDGFAQVDQMIESALSMIMSINGKSYEECMIFRQLMCKGAFDCVTHPMASFCACPAAFDIPIIYNINTKLGFIKSWHATLISTDEAFLFNGIADMQSYTLFKVRMGGQTPAEFASRFIDDSPPFWEPATTKLALVEAMLAYWLRCARNWRATCKTRREARTKNVVRLEAAGGMHRRSLVTGSSETIDPHENDSDDPLCRYVKFGGVPWMPGHQHIAVLYAKAEDGDYGYDLVTVVPCHEGCAPPHRGEVDLRTLTAPFVEEDMARAKAVKREW